MRIGILMRSLAFGCLVRRRVLPTHTRLAAITGLGDWDYGSKPKEFDAQVAVDPLTKALALLSDEDVSNALEIIAPLLTEKRKTRLELVLGKRCGRVQFLFENPANPSNVWACLRSMDAFGVAKVHVVADPKEYGAGEEDMPTENCDKGEEHARMRIRNMKSAAGSAQWLLLEEHESIKDALERIRGANPKVRVLSSDLSPGAIDINKISFGSSNSEPDGEVAVQEDENILVIMGNEDRGISEEARDLSDGRFFIPMKGFAESFNLSVATAITLAYLQAKNGLRPGSLSKHDRDRLRLRWYMQSAARGSAISVLRRHSIELPGLEGERNLPRQHIMGYRK